MKTRSSPCSYNAAYKAIRQKIMYGALQPNAKLRLSAVANSLNMSPTPVREALSRLSQEGFIETRQQRGFYVRPMSLDNLSELYALMHLNARYMLTRIHGSDDLPKLADPIRKAFNLASPIETARQFEDLHYRMASYADSPTAAKHLIVLMRRSHLVRLTEYNNPDCFQTLSQISHQIAQTAQDNDFRGTIDHVAAYFDVRQKWLPEIVEEARLVQKQLDAGSQPQQGELNANRV
ncbi:MAG: GntR family transcriptional regulator [Pseudomonadota bacterium]